MKKCFVSIAMLLYSCLSFGAGPVDGIYACNISLLGSSYSSYVTINGHPDGSSIYAIVAVSPSQDFYGYGIGTASATSFTGTTDRGAPFDIKVNPATGASTGTIGVVMNGKIYNATTTCGKIW
jgi:hypothetical protein